MLRTVWQWWKGVLLMWPLLLVTACAHTSNQRPLSLSLEEHPLAGKIYDVRQGRFIGQEQLAEALSGAEYILLGETHDNTAHHQGQAWVLGRLSSGQEGRPGKIAFEMMDEAQGQLLEKTPYHNVDELIGLLSHVDNQWGYEAYYRPVFAAALEGQWDVVAASQGRDAILKVVREGEAGVPEAVRALMQKTVLDAKQIEASSKEIEQSHCGMSNEKMVTAMMLTQRSKDAFMALALQGKNNEAAKERYKVLVAGSGHTRKDRGVPLYIRQLEGDAAILSLAWMEVSDRVEAVDAYASHWAEEGFPFDYVWFTPRVERPDPCEAFRKHMKKKQQKAQDEAATATKKE